MKKIISILIISFLFTLFIQIDNLFGAETTVTIMELDEVTTLDGADYIIVFDKSASITKRVSAQNAIIEFLKDKTIALDTMNVSGQVYAAYLEGDSIYTPIIVLDTIKSDVEITGYLNLGKDSLRIGGTKVTSAAEELNILDGVTGVEAAELSYIGDVTGLIQEQLDARCLESVFGTAIEADDLELSETTLQLADEIPHLDVAETITGNWVNTNHPWAESELVSSVMVEGENITLLDGTPGRIFYTNDVGDITELELGAEGTFLQSKGATAVPSFRTLIDADIPDNITITNISQVGDITATAGELNKCDGISSTAYQTVMEMVTFTETTGAGTYTGVITVPANSLILDVIWKNTSLWTATTSATLNVGDEDDPDGYFANIDLKTEPAVATPTNPVGFSSFKSDAGSKAGSYAGLLKHSTSPQVIIAEIVTVGDSGNAGRSCIFVTYSTPTSVEATKE